MASAPGSASRIAPPRATGPVRAGTGARSPGSRSTRAPMARCSLRSGSSCRRGVWRRPRSRGSRRRTRCSASRWRPHDGRCRRRRTVGPVPPRGDEVLRARSDEATAWWPSPFGADDQLGMLNHITDASRAAALRLVRSGRLYDLGRVLDEDVPVFPGRYFRQTLVTTAHHSNGGGLSANRVNWITEQIAGTQQLGTHLDALSHLQIGDRGYNGWTVSELADSSGVKRLGAETIPQIVTRGWLVDVSSRDLAEGGVIGVDDVLRVLDGEEPETGDA